MPSPSLLLTGFEPFDGDAFNPSGELAARLNGQIRRGVSVLGLTLPVSGPAAWAKLTRAARELRPRWILALGVSGRAEVSVESTAWNEADYRIPDNAGLQPRGEPVLARRAPVFRTPLDVEALAGRIHTEALPARVSADPGRYVCNWLYCRLLHLTRRPSSPARGRALFLHLPATTEMRRGADDLRPLFPLERVQAAVEGAIEFLLETPAGDGIPGLAPAAGVVTLVP